MTLTQRSLRSTSAGIVARMRSASRTERDIHICKGLIDSGLWDKHYRKLTAEELAKERGIKEVRRCFTALCVMRSCQKATLAGATPWY
jgi:hypothetical protein